MGLGLQEEMGADLLVGDTNLYEDSETRNNRGGGTGAAELSSMQRHEKNQEESIVKKFRVISQAEIMALLTGNGLPTKPQVESAQTE